MGRFRGVAVAEEEQVICVTSELVCVMMNEEALRR